MPDSHASPESRILVNGVELAPEMRVDVLDILIGQNTEGGDLFDMTVNALDAATLRLKWVDATEFSPGNRIDIQLGYRGNLITVFVGEITALKAQFENDRAAVLRVQGFDKLHRLRRGRKTRSFSSIKDSQIAERIAGELGLTADVHDSAIVHSYLIQNNVCDIDFLLQRARRIRYELLISDNKLTFRPTANHLSEVLALEYQRDLKWFHPRLSTAELSAQTSVRGWNPATKEAIIGVGRGGDETSRMGGQQTGPAVVQSSFGNSVDAVVEMPVVSQAEADQIAKALFNEMALALLSGDGEAVGDPQLRAGSTIRLDGLGRRFSGLYYLRRTEHRFGPKSGYVTRFSVSRNSS
jgi:uncharacterized protein